MGRRKVVVTGVGLVSSLGETLDAHVDALRGGPRPVVDEAGFAPYPIHPLAEIDLSLQIPKRGDQRQMEGWQRLGVYAAGVALASAGLEADAAAKDRMELIVAAGGGERDHEVDSAITTGLLHEKDRAAYLNEHLMNDLRPTLFLAQLSNLLAGNIAIVHGVTGGSRTFMGEEQAGVDALRVATERIAAGQCDMIMVGGAYNAERRDMLLLYELGGMLHKGAYAPVFSNDRTGAIMGSAGAFLVLEAAETAAARGAKPLAEVTGVASGRARKGPGAATEELGAAIAAVGPFGPEAEVLSAASGIAPWTAEERAAIGAALPDAKVIATGDHVGHGVEAAFPVAAAMAAALIAAGDAAEALVTNVGHQRGVGAARLRRPDAGGAA